MSNDLEKLDEMPTQQSVNIDSTPDWREGFTKFCPCCVGGIHRKGYKTTKVVSKWKSQKARRTSHKVAARLRKEARPDKYE